MALTSIGLSMAYEEPIEDTLFEMPAPSAPAELTIEERMEEFTKLAKNRGGLIPVTAAADLLGVHRSRLYQLIDSGRLEKINYCGVAFLTGRSIKDWRTDRQQTGGRGQKKIGPFKGLIIGAKIGAGIGKAVAG